MCNEHRLIDWKEANPTVSTRTWFDEIPWLTNAFAEHQERIYDTYIRITFNRDFTWSEREAFRKFTEKNDIAHHFSNPAVVYLESDLESRKLWELVANFVAGEYVNIHARAVRTFEPEVVV